MSNLIIQISGGGNTLNSQDSQERIEYYDIAKGIGIFLVVFAHIYTMSTNLLGDIIYTFHMPLFFLLSGITTNCNKSFIKYVKQNAYSILVPYYAWCFISFGYWACIERNFRSGSANIPILKAFLGIFYGGYNGLAFNYVLWFLPVFFSVKVLFYIIRKYLPAWGTVCVVLLFSMIGILLLRQELFWGINKTFKYVAFFGIGSMIKGVEFRKYKFSLIAGIILFICLDLFYKCKLPSCLEVYMLGTIGCLGVLLLSASVEKYTKLISIALSRLGKITMGILVMHGPLYRVLIIVSSKILQIDVETIRGNLGISFVLSTLTILMLVWPINLINKYMPALLGRKKINNSVA